MQALAEVTTVAPPAVERDNRWLRQELSLLWNRYFPDIPKANTVTIEYSRSWKNRLGMICLSLSGRTSYIGINSLLRLPQVPDVITLITVAHELVHYAHGFGSPLPRRFEHPHRGGVVLRELQERGLGEEYEQCREWIREHWESLYARYGSAQGRRRLIVP
jgi:hypothetical protein